MSDDVGARGIAEGDLRRSVGGYTDEDERRVDGDDPDAPEHESPLTYEAGPGFFLPVGTGPRKARRLADEAGVTLWWHKRQEFIDSGKDYVAYFGRELDEINPQLLDEDGIPIPTLYTGTTIWGKPISATPIPIYSRATEAKGGVAERWKPSISRPIPSVRCTTVKKDGHQCPNWALRGATVCVSHGGRLPSVKAHADATVEAARMRLIDMSDSAVDVLKDLITTVGTADAIRLKAATEVLDRSGVRGGVEINMEVEHTVKAESVVADRFAEIVARKKAEQEVLEKHRLAQLEAEADIEDAEVVD